MEEADELVRALGDAGLALEAEPSTDPADPARLSRVGAGAVASLLSFEGHLASGRPPIGAADPLREARHDVRAAAQTVLAQLELISLAWAAWDGPTRAVVIDELEDAADELERQVEGCIAAAP